VRAKPASSQADQYFMLVAVVVVVDFHPQHAAAMAV
jgi:hypothetical protein